jgi:predicted ferric reductase
MNHEFGKGNNGTFVSTRTEQLDSHNIDHGKVTTSKASIDALLSSVTGKIDTTKKASCNKVASSTKVVIDSFATKQSSPSNVIFARPSSTDISGNDSIVSDISYGGSMILSGVDELATEQHNSILYQRHSTPHNSGSIPSSGSFAYDDSAVDPSSGSFHCDIVETNPETIATPRRVSSDTSHNPVKEKDRSTKTDKHEPSLEDLMSIIEFDDPDCIEDASYHASFKIPSSTSLAAVFPKLNDGGGMRKYNESSSEFFPNSSIDLMKENDIEYPEKPRCLNDEGYNLQNSRELRDHRVEPTARKRKMSEVLEINDDKCTPNRPHPALEYPPLYYLLRRCQWLFDKIKIPYAYRWRLSYPLQKNVPFGKKLQTLGIHSTWGELLIMIPFFVSIIICMMCTVVVPSVSVTGKIARFGLISTLVFAQKNSMITLLLGMPCDRALFYHKLSAYVAGTASVLHTAAFFIDPKFTLNNKDAFCYGAFTGKINLSGSLMMVTIVVICVSALPRVRRRIYELFYYLHIILSMGLVAGALFHTGLVVPVVAVCTWGVDLFIRSIVMARTRYPRKATIKIVSDTVIELSFPKTTAFAYNPGQYVHLAIPELSWLEWHPFSLSSSPKQRVVTIHIRIVGNWTKSLFNLCKTKSEVSILLEGPYGNLSVDLLTDRKYKNIMLISGGIGSTIL